MKRIFLLTLILIASITTAFSQIKPTKGFSKTSSQDWNWQFSGTPLGDTTVSGILIDPEDENIWYVSSSQNGLYITRNSGNSWEHPLVGKGLDEEGYQIDPNNLNNLFVTIWDKLYISNDKGLSWKNIYTCPEYIRSIFISSKNGYIYIGPQTEDNNNPGVYRSTDGGETFSHLSFGINTQYVICWDIEEDTKNNALYVATELAAHPQPYDPPLFYSFDNGNTWTDISNTLNWHSLKLQIDTTSSTIFFQEEGGSLYKSTNFGSNWEYLSSEYIMRLYLDKQHPNRLFGGSHNGGAYFSSNGGKSFVNIGLSGKNAYSMVVNSNSTKVYAVCYGDGIYSADFPDKPTSNLLVTNTNDSGISSLRNAIEESNSRHGIDTIQFRIPKSDPNYNLSKGVWEIKPDSSLPTILDTTLVIDGTSQRKFIGEDTNINGPEIVINGSNAKGYAYCLMTQAIGTEIYELTINNFTAAGISFFLHSSGVVSGCYIGTDYTGMVSAGNENGIQIFDCDKNNVLVGPSSYLDKHNIISGNKQYGIYIIGSSYSILILGNYVGLNRTKTDTIGNGNSGIYLKNGTGINKISNNYISGNWDGILINNFTNIDISNNFIGTSNIHDLNFGNKVGISIWNNSANNKIVENTIGYSINDGIHIEGENSVQNIISRNSIFSNVLAGINNLDGGNLELDPPVISSVKNNEIKGFAGANQIIEIFADSSDEGKTFLDSTLSDTNGNFILVYSPLPDLPYLTATTRDSYNNTSEFSLPFHITNSNTNHIIVTNTIDTGEGSFRNAIDLANSNLKADTIKFNIPKSDPNFDFNKGVWVIKPESLLPGIFDSNLVIDGTSQRLFIGEDTNSEGPEIVLTGNAGLNRCLRFISGSNGSEIYELTINNFNYTGISFYSCEGCIVSGCYIGTDYTGTKSTGMNAGIALSKSNDTFIGPSSYLNKPNVISGNRFSGVYISDSSQYNNIIGNYIGLNKIASDTVGNTDYGISLDSFSDNNIIENNLICGNYIGITSSNSNNNNILRNLIGTNESFDTNFGNTYGIFLWRNTSKNKIIENIIGYNSLKGIQVDSANCIQNLISRNSISKNGLGVFNNDGGNKELTPPILTSVTNNQIRGTAGANQVIEIFADSSNQGQIYIDSTLSNASGDFSLSISSLPELPNITATARDAFGNTSEFCSPFIITSMDERNIKLPTKYALYQNYPNPFNPSTTIKYSIPSLQTHLSEGVGGGLVTLKVYNIHGQEVATLVNQNKPSGYYEIIFNANNLPSGVYYYRLKTGNFTVSKKMLLLE